DDEGGMAIHHVFEPAQIGARVVELPGTGARGGDIGALCDVDVVVELEVADAVLVHESIDDLVEVRARRGVTEVALVPPGLDHPLTAALEERLPRQGAGAGAVHADDLGPGPQAGADSTPAAPAPLR